MPFVIEPDEPLDQETVKKWEAEENGKEREIELQRQSNRDMNRRQPGNDYLPNLSCSRSREVFVGISHSTYILISTSFRNPLDPLFVERSADFKILSLVLLCRPGRWAYLLRPPHRSVEFLVPDIGRTDALADLCLFSIISFSGFHSHCGIDGSPQYWGKKVDFFSLCMYVVARAYLIVAIFASLRSQPVSVYDDLCWTVLLPHI